MGHGRQILFNSNGVVPVLSDANRSQPPLGLIWPSAVSPTSLGPGRTGTSQRWAGGRNPVGIEE